MMHKQADIFQAIAEKLLAKSRPAGSIAHGAAGGALGAGAYGLYARKEIKTLLEQNKAEAIARADLGKLYGHTELDSKLRGGIFSRNRALSNLTNPGHSYWEAIRKDVHAGLEKELLASNNLTSLEGLSASDRAAAVQLIKNHPHMKAIDSDREGTIESLARFQSGVTSPLKAGAQLGSTIGVGIGTLRGSRHTAKVNRLANVLQAATLGTLAGGTGYTIARQRNMHKQSSISTRRAAILSTVLAKEANLETGAAKRLVEAGLERFVPALNKGEQPLTNMLGNKAGGGMVGDLASRLNPKRLLLGRTTKAEGAILGAKPLQASDPEAWKSMVDERAKNLFDKGHAHLGDQAPVFPQRGSPEYNKFLKDRHPIIVQHNREMANKADLSDPGAWGARFKDHAAPEMYHGVSAPGSVPMPAAAGATSSAAPASAVTTKAEAAAASKANVEANKPSEKSLTSKVTDFASKLTGTDVAAVASPLGAAGMYSAGHKINPGIDWNRFTVPVGAAAAGGGVLGAMSSRDRR